MFVGQSTDINQFTSDIGAHVLVSNRTTFSTFKEGNSINIISQIRNKFNKANSAQTRTKCVTWNLHLDWR